jgi:hypothetical protein
MVSLVRRVVTRKGIYHNSRFTMIANFPNGLDDPITDTGLTIVCMTGVVLTILAVFAFSIHWSANQQHLTVPITHLLIHDGRHIPWIKGVPARQIARLWHVPGYVSIGRTRGYSHLECMTLVNGIDNYKKKCPSLMSLIFVVHARIVDTRTMDHAIRRLVEKFPHIPALIVDLEGNCIRSIEDTRP